jgi:CRP/FNR family transcriptional regulator, anaerobic regulatory protein
VASEHIQFRTSRLSAFGTLNPSEQAALQSLAEPYLPYGRNETIRHEGQSPPGLYHLLEGWAISSIALVDGARQYLKVHLPGDLMGAPSLPYDHAVETLTTLTSARVAKISLPALGKLFVDFPRLGTFFYLVSQEERVMLMERLAGIGRLDAFRRIAALFVHLHERQVLLGRDPAAPIEMPLTQDQIADLLGLTPIHVNRTLRRMDVEGYVVRKRGEVMLNRFDELRAMVGLPTRTVQRDLGWLPASQA